MLEIFNNMEVETIESKDLQKFFEDYSKDMLFQDTINYENHIEIDYQRQNCNDSNICNQKNFYLKNQFINDFDK